MRRQFRLPGADEAALEQLALNWEALVDAGRRWIILYGFRLPEGFNQTVADLAVEIVAGYPPGALDMAYFSPALNMPSGRTIAQTNVVQQIDGKPWQRWSRHRTPDNAWRLGEDSLETHIDYVVAFLAAEVARGR
jgi:E2/UBC family protein E